MVFFNWRAEVQVHAPQLSRFREPGLGDAIDPAHPSEGFQSLLDAADQSLVAVGLAHEAHGACLHGASPDALLGIGGDEYDRHSMTVCNEAVLKFYSTQSWHLQISDQAGRVVQALRPQKFF